MVKDFSMQFVVLSERALSVDRPRPLESPLPLNVLLLCMPAMHVYIRVGGYRVTVLKCADSA